MAPRLVRTLLKITAFTPIHTSSASVTRALGRYSFAALSAGAGSRDDRRDLGRALDHSR